MGQADKQDERDEKLMLISDRLHEVYGDHAAFVVIVQPHGENCIALHNLDSGRTAIPLLNLAAIQFGDDDFARRRYMRGPTGTLRLLPVEGSDEDDEDLSGRN